MSELDQTIEELEAEVLAELEEASEKPLGKAKDLGLGSNNADEGISKSKDPAANVAGADKRETVAGERKDLGGAKPEAKVEKDADEDRSEKEIGKKATSASKKVSDVQNKGAKEEPKVKQGSSGEATPGEKVKLAAGDDLDLNGDELVEGKKLTKTQHLENIAKMKKSDIEEMIANHASKLEEAENVETEEALKELKDAKADIEEKIKNISVKEDVAALIEGEGLSEEFQLKAAHIFEAAVKSKIRSEVERIVEETQSEKNQEIETFVSEMTEKVDNYLNYVVDEWTKENELAIERGLKGEIAEDFISGLKQLFEDHYIDVPDEKYDVLEAQSDKISELEGKLNEAIQKNVEFKTSNSELVREQVISEVSEDLADTESEKFKSLTQDVEFVDEVSFREKLDTLKENYFPRVIKSSDITIDDEDGGTAQDIDTTGAMKSYMSAISRNKARAE